VIAGQDGMFYALQKDKIIAFNQSGKLERTLAFRKPNESWLAIRLDVSAGVASIELAAPEVQADHPQPLITRLLLLDVQTGEQRGVYGFSPGMPSSVMCFSRQDGFSVYGVENGQAVRRWFPLP
jgi:hypothetical protein